MLELLQIHSAPAEADTLGLEQEALLQGGFAAQRDASPGAQNTLPRQAAHLSQDTADVASAARIPGSLGDGSVGAHAPTRHSADGRGNGGSQWRLLT